MEEENFVSGRDAGDWELLRMLRKDLEKRPVLSREEEAAVARRAKAGDQTAANLLVESNLRFVIYVVFKRWRRGLPLMDLISVGCMGLLQAAKTFDPERGFRFVTYAHDAIANRVYKAIGNYYRNKHASLDDPVYKDEAEMTFKDLLVAECPGPDEIAASKQTRRALIGMNNLERQIIFLRFWLDLGLDEIAARLGYSRGYVARIEKGALRKMRWSMTCDFSADQQRTPKCAGVAGCVAR